MNKSTSYQSCHWCLHSSSSCETSVDPVPNLVTSIYNPMGSLWSECEHSATFFADRNKAEQRWTVIQSQQGSAITKKLMQPEVWSIALALRVGKYVSYMSTSSHHVCNKYIDRVVSERKCCCIPVENIGPIDNPVAHTRAMHTFTVYSRKSSKVYSDSCDSKA